MSTPISLPQMPDDAIGKILEKCDYQSIQVLRKVCHDLQNFIDDVKPDANLTQIGIMVHSQAIVFYLNSEYCKDSEDYKNLWWMLRDDTIVIHYNEHPTGCLVVCDEKEKQVLENENFVSVFFKDFEIVMKHQKTLLHYFHLSFQFDNDEEQRIMEQTIAEPLLQNLKRILKSRSQPLQIKSINFMRNNAMMSILPYIDSLKIIKIFGANRPDGTLDLDEIVKLDQWKNADELELGYCIVSAAIQNFTHFSNVRIDFGTVNAKDIIFLKEEFLRNPRLKMFELSFNRIVNQEQVVQSFGPPKEIGLLHDSWVFRVPDAVDQTLAITLSPIAYSFRRIEKMVDSRAIERVNKEIVDDLELD